MADERTRDALTPLRELAQLPEHRFSSTVPLIGGLIAAFRREWNNISTRWYVSPMADQQSAFNQLAVEQLAGLLVRAEEQAAQLAQLQGTVAELARAISDDQRGLQAQTARLQTWLVEQDHEQAELRHDLGELAVFATQLARHDEHPLGQTDEPAA